MLWLNKLGASLSQGFSQVSDLFSKQNVGSNQNGEVGKTELTSFWAGLFTGKNTATPGFNSNAGLNFTAQKIQLSTDEIKESLARQAQRENPTQIKPGKPDQNTDPRLALPAPKAIIIPLSPGRKQAGYDELARRTTEATLRQNGINPTNIEIEELMALPGSKNLDMNGWLDKNWKFHDLPGLMPEAGKHQDINGNEMFGYKQTLSPKFQQSVIDDYKKVTGELALTPDKKAVVEMSLNERMSESIKIALDKGYISKEISAELNKLTPDQLAAAFGIGGAVGLAAKTGAKSLIPVLGTALAFKEGLEQYAEFEGFALGCAKATSREDLDRPAQEFGKWMGKLSKDGVMAVTAWAGAKIAPAVMPAATAKAEQVVTSTVKGVKQAMTKTSSLDDAVLATPEGVTVKMPTGKTPLAEITDPKKIVTVDSNGNPSGTRFRDDYEAHISQREFSRTSQRSGVNGAHNMNELEQYSIAVNPTLTKDSINITSKTPHPTVKGIYKIEYQMPTLNGAQKPTGTWRYKSGTDPFVKTVYDPAVISNKQMAQWGREAFADAAQNGGIDMAKRTWSGFASNGLRIGGYVDDKTNAVRTFYPEF